MIGVREKIGCSAGGRVFDDDTVRVDRECPVRVVLEETAVGEDRDVWRGAAGDVWHGDGGSDCGQQASGGTRPG